ncbi:condensation domain-containing protein [Streptomyces sp. NPDC046994]|uniref:condensation domain-containing protein n=1 Tax=Streptomyces sp. NPDC046994 TaxID=3155735 RepID=UPI003453EF11
MTEQNASATECQFWLNEWISPGSPAGQILARIRAQGPVGAVALEEALFTVVKRHEAMRTRFWMRGERLVRDVLPEPVAQPVLRLAAGTGFREAAAALLHYGCFDLAAGRVFRIGVAHDDEGATVYVAVHHIAFDGISQEIFAADLAHAYAQAVKGVTTPPPVIRRAQPAALSQGRRAELTAHWRALLAGAAPLPAYGTGPTQRELAEAELVERRSAVLPTTWRAVGERAQGVACSPFSVLMAAYAAALSALSGGTDFCIGIPVATRTADQSQEIGCLINMLPVRMPDLSENGMVERVAEAVRSSIIGMELPGTDIIRSGQADTGHRMPVYQALFAFEGWQRASHAAAGVTFQAVAVPPVGGLAEVCLQVCEGADGTLDCLAQAPVSSPWADRLSDLLRAFDTRLSHLVHRAIRSVSSVQKATA